MFEDQQVWPFQAMELDAASVVPLYVSSELFAVLENDDHGGLVIHLLLIIEALGVSLLGGHSLAIRVLVTATMRGLALGTLSHFSQGRSDQFPVHYTSSSIEFGL